MAQCQALRKGNGYTCDLTNQILSPSEQSSLVTQWHLTPFLFHCCQHYHLPTIIAPTENKITPTCSSLHFRKKKEKGSEKVTLATELLRKSVQLTFSHYFNLIYLCQLIFCIYEIQTVLFQPTTFHALVWKKKNNFLRGQRLLPPPWLMLLCPPAAEKAEAIQTWAQPLRAGGGSFEEEQTTNKLHGHYPLCILVLIGVADPCLLIRKGSRKTHKFSQGSQTAWSHIRQLRMLPWAQKQNRA